MLKSKKLPKSENLPKIDTKKVNPIFLTFNIKITFNYLWLAFIKAIILWHFDPKSYN